MMQYVLVAASVIAIVLFTLLAYRNGRKQGLIDAAQRLNEAIAKNEVRSDANYIVAWLRDRILDLRR